MSNLLQVQELHKSFVEGAEEVQVLRGLDMDVEERDRVAIVGESGVGKSTLLHILGTLDRPTRGRVMYRGKDLSQLTEEEVSEFRNHEIGFIFQFHYLLPDFTALENVMLPALIRGWEWEKARSESEQLLTAVGLKDRVTHKPGKLSGGEQQRVAVARALILRPSLLLADEPTGDLDPRIGEEIQHLLLQLNEERGVALVIATHSRQLATRIGRQMELRDGRLFPQ